MAMLNSAPMAINAWSDKSIVITIPTGAVSGYLVVIVAPTQNNSNPVYFEVTSQPLPMPWLDQDVGAVGPVGSATYSNGTYTVQAGGTDVYSTADGMHFVYQPLSGDGTIVARVVSLVGGGNYPKAGVMIRETLGADATNAYMFDLNYYIYGSNVQFSDRTATGGSTNQTSTSGYARPVWVKLVRSGNTFTGYVSTDGVNWTQFGTSQTINMTTSVYVGLSVTSNNTSTPVTATFDSVTFTGTP